MDLFTQKQLPPMLIGQSGPAFNSSDYIYEIKWDGTRCIAYLDSTGVHLENKRFKILTGMFPELQNIHRQVNCRCILDGELFVYDKGRVDFAEAQRRSLMSNSFKIRLAAEKLPVSFVAFDILYKDNRELLSQPLMERKKQLQKAVPAESERFAITRYVETDGIGLYQLAEQQQLEGIVAKRKDSLYYKGKRTKEWVKCKNLCDEDFLVCGYYHKAENLVSIILGSYVNSSLAYQGHVVMGVSKMDFKKISAAEKCRRDSFYDGFPDFEGAYWLRPMLVCKVEYMERTSKGGLRQPTFRGLRDDKAPEDCQSE